MNDPRNELVVKYLREEKNEHLLHLLKEDSLNLMANTTSYRQKLLIMRQSHIELMNVQIPLLEREIINNPELLDKLETFYKEDAREVFEREKRKLKG